MRFLGADRPGYGGTARDPDGEWLAAHVPGARSTVVPEAGHIDVLVQGPGLVPALRSLSGS